MDPKRQGSQGTQIESCPLWKGPATCYPSCTFWVDERCCHREAFEEYGVTGLVPTWLQDFEKERDIAPEELLRRFPHLDNGSE